MNEQIRREIGKRIQKTRERLGLTQEEFAASFEKKRQAISKWELGKSMPTGDDWYLMGAMSGVSLDYLIYGVLTTPVLKSPIIEKIFSAAGVEGISLAVVGTRAHPLAS